MIESPPVFYRTSSPSGPLPKKGVGNSGGPLQGSKLKKTKTPNQASNPPFKPQSSLLLPYAKSIFSGLGTGYCSVAPEFYTESLVITLMC